MCWRRHRAAAMTLAASALVAFVEGDGGTDPRPFLTAVDVDGTLPARRDALPVRCWTGPGVDFGSRFTFRSVRTVAWRVLLHGDEEGAAAAS